MRAKWDYRLPSYEIFPPKITNLSQTKIDQVIIQRSKNYVSAAGEFCSK